MAQEQPNRQGRHLNLKQVATQPSGVRATHPPGHYKASTTAQQLFFGLVAVSCSHPINTTC
ncbi:hypothetical protein GQ44DRAFT_705816 [Phaeosphaeriaceae sp. PMI808]|nr:hypothetical protein GQ44DRAFT_705816 [Phaeosphaeriaceae sp. PMI808]